MITLGGILFYHQGLHLSGVSATVSRYSLTTKVTECAKFLGRYYTFANKAVNLLESSFTYLSAFQYSL